MKLAAILAFLVALIVPATLQARPVYLFGEIGKSSVLAAVDQEGDRLSGWYLYPAVGKELQLSGQIDASGSFRLDESVDAHKTGVFEGKSAGGRWNGEWRNAAGGAPLAFSMTENREALADASGLFRCVVKQQKQGWTFRQSLTLELAKGALKALKASAAESSAQDGEQGCFYSLEDFTPVPSDVGLVLKAKDEDQPLDADSQRCTIQVVGDADHLLVQFGDPWETHNDCRFSGTTAFCSPRSWMTDFVVDRRTKSCKPIE
ncbi:MAG TPA: hypothetical protein VGH40_05250 [Roseiarcus sp.]|jgi:hypothetical protein